LSECTVVLIINFGIK